MKLNIIIATISLQLIAMVSLAQDGDSVLGIWQSAHGNGRIQIYRSGNTYDGKLVWIKEAVDESGKPKLDVNNPSPKLKTQPVKDLEVLRDFKYKNNGVWEDGTVYDPRSGKTYSCKLLMSSSDTLEIRAYMGISIIGKSQVWSRVR